MIAAGSIERGRSLRGPQQFEADVIVVGSGASGAVVACELAAAGQDVLIIEEGPWFPSEELQTMRPSESLRHVWREGALSAAFGIGNSPMINVTMGRCVGGSSVLTGGVCFRTPGYVLNDWVRDHGLAGYNEADLDPYFSEVEEAIHVEDVPVAMRSKATTLWADGARQMGVEIKSNRRNTKNCDGCSRCNFGCPKGAKMSVDMNYLPRALRHGARILSDCLVEKVLTQGGRAIGIRGRLYNRGGKKRGDRVEIRAKRVVLAAGAAHSPVILKNSGIGRESGQVGRNLTLHPSFRMIARFEERVDGWKGAMQSAHSDHWEDEGITMMSVFTPPSVVVSALPGFGPKFREYTSQLPYLAMFGGLLHDDPSGRVRRGPGREPLMTYRMSDRDRAKLPKIVRRLGEAYLKAGAVELFLPILGHDSVTADEFRAMDLDAVPARRYEVSSQHPLGTTRMGGSPEHSVVNEDGKCWGVDDLYVVDGGVLPTSLGVNPQLSIMTVALRMARRIAETPLRER